MADDAVRVLHAAAPLHLSGTSNTRLRASRCGARTGGDICGDSSLVRGEAVAALSDAGPSPSTVGTFDSLTPFLGSGSSFAVALHQMHES